MTEEFDGEIVSIKEYGAFAKLEDGREGLVHISEIADEYVSNVKDFLKVGDKKKFIVIKTNPDGKCELSIKRAIIAAKKRAMHREREMEIENSGSGGGGFEKMMTSFLKKSEQKQVDVRRNLKIKQGFKKRK